MKKLEDIINKKYPVNKQEITEFIKQAFDMGSEIGYDDGHTAGYKECLKENVRGRDDYELDEIRENAYDDARRDMEEDWHDRSYNSGYEEGQERGYREGRAEAIEEGYADGEEYGYNKGRVDGEEDGYQKGYAEGYADGEEYGYKMGYEGGLLDIEK